MATTTGEYSDEKIFVDPTAESEKVALEGQGDFRASSGRMAVVNDAPDAITANTTWDPEEKMAVTTEQTKDTEALILVQRKDTLDRDAAEKQAVTSDHVPSPIDHPPSYISPTRTSASSLFPSNQPRSYREYPYYHAAPWRPTHNTIVDPENCARYFIEVSEFSKGKPDVSFHDVRSSNAQFSAKRENLNVDEGKSCPVVAFAQYPHGTNDQVRLGIGSAEQMQNVRWVQMSRRGMQEPWNLVLGNGKDTERRFEWRTGGAGSSAPNLDAASPTSDVPESSSAGTPLPGTVQLVDVGKGEVVATYTELKIGRSLKKRGKLRIYEHAWAGVSEFEKDAELLVMLSVAAMNEKRRRKTWKKWALLGAG